MDRVIIKPWADLLTKEIKKDYFLSLWKFVEYEYTVNICYPPAHKIFAALNECPPNKVKAVILGQDPYHEEGQALYSWRLCFDFPTDAGILNYLRGKEFCVDRENIDFVAKYFTASD